MSWTREKINDWVLETAGVERDLLNMIKRKKLSYFGHWMRKERNCLEKEIMQGTVPGARKQGRPGMRWIVNMEKWMGMSFDKLLMGTKDRGRQGTEGDGLVYEATNHRSEDS